MSSWLKLLPIIFRQNVFFFVPCQCFLSRLKIPSHKLDSNFKCAKDHKANQSIVISKHKFGNNTKSHDEHWFDLKTIEWKPQSTFWRTFGNTQQKRQMQFSDHLIKVQTFNWTRKTSKIKNQVVWRQNLNLKKKFWLKGETFTILGNKITSSLRKETPDNSSEYHTVSSAKSRDLKFSEETFEQNETLKWIEQTWLYGKANEKFKNESLDLCRDWFIKTLFTQTFRWCRPHRSELFPALAHLERAPSVQCPF